MKKCIYFTLQLFSFLLLNSVSNYDCIFTAIEPSSINRALGMTTGSVNIWHNSPLMNYANPAVGSFQEGLSLNFTKDKWFDKVDGLNDMYYNASILSYGYKGISVTLPFYNASKGNYKFGITMDYGKQEQIDAEGNFSGTFHSYESAQVYGLGFNMIEMYRNFYNNDIPLLNHFDVAVGANFVSIISDLAPYNANSKNLGKATKLDIGTIARYSYCLNDFINIEAVYGLSHINAGKSKISYANESQTDIVYRHRNQGFAGSLSILSKNYFSDTIPDKYLFFENILSMRYLHSIEDDFNSVPNIVGYGTEIGFFDTVFIRKGYYDDTAGYVKGQTFGIGINLHYKKIVALTYNYASFPGGEFQKTQKSSDFGLTADFLKLMQLTRSN